MRSGLAVVVLLATALGGAGAAVAAPPPGAAELDQWLRREPLDAKNWPAWSARLREWSAEYFQPAAPAFQKAFAFIQQVQTGQPGRRRGLPKPLEKDPVAWMLLAGASLEEAKSSPSPVPALRAAAEAARQSLRLDGRLARSHFYSSQALRLEQLTAPEKGGPARPDRQRLREALKALQRAHTLAPTVRWLTPEETAHLAVQAEQWQDAITLLRLALREKPDDGPLLCQLAQALARDHQPEEAAAELARARELGTDPSTVVDPNWVRDLDQQQARKQAESDRLKAEAERRRAEAEAQRQLVEAPGRWARTLGWWAMLFAIFYGLVMGAMCLAGWLLARKTKGSPGAELGEALVQPTVRAGRVVRSRNETHLGRWYLSTLLAALVLFYASLPVVFLGLLIVFLLLLGLGLVGRVGRGSGDEVHLDLLRASGGGMGAVFKAMFARTGSGNFAIRQRKEHCPRLFAAVEDVARRIDTEPPDEVWIAPGSDFSVYQEGRGPFGMFGARKRVLTLGLCVFHFLTVSELKSILAHELAHFSHADTFWNRFVFQVTLSLRTAIREMTRTGGWVTWCNPFFWYFWLYSRSFNLLSAGFSRSRESLADRMACLLYGSDVFESALRKVCTEGTHFEKVIYKNVERLLRTNQAYVNMYLAFRNYRNEVLPEAKRRQLHQDLLEAPASVFASHPTFQERSEAARRLPVAGVREDTSALHLFEHPEEVERELTDFLTEAVAR